MIRGFSYLLGAALLVLAGAIAAWLLVEAAGNYGGDCYDGERQAYQLAFSGVALLAALAACADLYRRWRGHAARGLLPLSLTVLLVAGMFAVLLVGCGG